MKEFKDNVAVITGAGSGIGRAIAERFAREEMKIVLADVEELPLSKAEGELRDMGTKVIGVLTDVSNAEDVERLARKSIETFGAVHILCNNAGVFGDFAPLWRQSLKDWEWVLGVNLWGVIHGIRTFEKRKGDVTLLSDQPTQKGRKSCWSYTDSICAASI